MSEVEHNSEYDPDQETTNEEEGPAEVVVTFHERLQGSIIQLF